MPPLTVSFAQEALADLRSIAQESIDRFGVQQARRYNAALRAGCDRIGEYPQIGPLQDDLATIRGVVYGQHRIYYVIEAERILVLRVLHQRVRLADTE